MKKNEWILLIITVIFVGATIYVHQIVGREHPGYVRIIVAGEEMGVFDMSENQEIEIEDTNVLKIQDGGIDMISSTCEDQLCVHQTVIRENNEGILCMENDIAITIDNKESQPLDTIAQ